jgi:CCR4-NOT transcriptional complex subunit CAF120
VLRGTILSLWDAAEVDAAGDNHEVVPTFINLTDASIKMVWLLEFSGHAR